MSRFSDCVTLAVVACNVTCSGQADDSAVADTAGIAETAAWVQQPGDLFVSPCGSDTNPGTMARPLKTLGAAQLAARQAKQGLNRAYNITLRGGVYELAAPLVLTDADSGVTYQSMPGELARITGGTHMAPTWTDCGGGTLCAPVGPQQIRQLYVNGTRATLARTPNLENTATFGPFFRVHAELANGGNPWIKAETRVAVNAADVEGLPALQKPTEVEMVAIKKWSHAIFPLASSPTVEAKIGYLDLAPTAGAESIKGNNPPVNMQYEPYFLQNAVEFLDAPGEWYYDSAAQILHYMPRAGENAANLTIDLPQFKADGTCTPDALVIIQGTPTSPAKDITLQGISFENTNWSRDFSQGVVGYEINWYNYPGTCGNYSSSAPGAIEVLNASDVTVRGSRFVNLGGNGINLRYGTIGTNINDNYFNAIAATAVAVIGGAQGKPDPALISEEDTVSGNLIDSVAQDYFGSVGIAGLYVFDFNVTNNEIRNLPYDGIAISQYQNPNRSITGDVHILYNHVHHVMQAMNDGAAIYLESNQCPLAHDCAQFSSVIAHNFIHDLAPTPWNPPPPYFVGVHAIGFDSGAANTTVAGNSWEKFGKTRWGSAGAVSVASNAVNVNVENNRGGAVAADAVGIGLLLPVHQDAIASLATTTPGVQALNTADLACVPSTAIHLGLTEAQCQPLGDANGDGMINLDDYAVLDAHVGQTVTGGPADGDLNGDGVVDGSDYTLIDNMYNSAATPPGSTPLPIYCM